MPQLVAGIEFVIEAIALFATEAGIGAYATMYYAATVIVYGALIYAAYSTFKSATGGFSGLAQSAGSKLSMFRDPVPAQRVVYGTQRLSGPIIFAQTVSKAASDKNEYLDIIVALAGHEVNAINEVYLGDNYANTAGGTSLAPYNSYLTINRMLGSPTSSVNAAVQSIVGAGVWTANHKLQGIAAIHARLEFNQDIYQSGIPNISCVVQGKKIYDPRSSTTTFSENPALIVRDYLLNELGATAAEVDDTAIITAANICDEMVPAYGVATEKRYTCNYSFLTSEKPAKILENILTSCYGKLVYTNGKFVVKVGAYVTPTLTLQEDDMRGGLTVITKNSISDAYNGVKGLYTEGSNASSSFLPADFVSVTSSYYQYVEDNGFQNFVDIELPATIYQTTARRLAKLNLLDSRQNLTCQGQFKIGAMKLVAGDFVYLNNSRMGWALKPFEVTQLDVTSDLGVDLSLREAASAIYDWVDADADVIKDLSPNTNLPDPFAVPGPTGFTATELVSTGSDGSITSQAQVSWSSLGTGSVSSIELEYKKSSATGYSGLGIVGTSATSIITPTVQNGLTYNFRGRSIAYSGVRSSWSSASLVITGDIAAPSAPTGFSVASSNGCNLLAWNANTEADIDTYDLYRSTTNNFSTSTFAWSGYATKYSDFFAPIGTLAYYWLKSEDTTGNTSSLFAGPVSASATPFASGSVGPSGSNGTNGTNGASGSNGTNGTNTATIYIYQRAASTPSLPSATTTYTFSTAALTGLDNGWATSIPATNGQALYTSAATATGTGLTDTIGSGEWASAIIMAQDGAGGITGSNSATVFLYQRSAGGAPSVPGSTTTYTFSNSTLTGTLGSWTQSVPAGTDPIYVTTATAFSNTATDSILTSEWAAVRVLAQNGINGSNGSNGASGSNGTNGTDGNNSATVHLYQRAGSTPSVPGTTTTYTFATSILTGTLGSWTQAVPATNGQPCYITTAVAVSNTTTDSIATGDWSSPVIFVQDGATGSISPQTFILILSDTVGNPTYKAHGNGNDCSAGYAFPAGTVVAITCPGGTLTHPSAGTDFITWSGTWASKLDVENILNYNTNVVMTKDTTLTADYP